MGTVRILQGNVLDTLPTVEPGSIDCAVTSPPYWMLRSYLPKDHPLKGLELGQEKTPQEYVANMVRVCGLVRDALADHGTLWLNVGDTYSGSTMNGGTANRHPNMGPKSQPVQETQRRDTGIGAGNLCLIPQRLMIALQDDGWLVRSVVIWHKPAPMPTSVTGWMWRRCRVETAPSRGAKADSKHHNAALTPNGARNGKDFDSGAEWRDCPGCKKCEPHGGYVLRRGSWRPTSAWEPIIMLAKSARYFADGEAVKTPPAESTTSRDAYTRVIDDPDEQFAVRHDHETQCVSGANLRDVWTIAHEPLREAHYAAYPSELVYRCLRAGTSQEGYCEGCGAPFVRVVDHTNAVIEKTDRAEAVGNRVTCSGTQHEPAKTTTLGWRPSCDCPDAKPRPGRVLDPFCGSGRTAVVAGRLGLDFTGCELNPQYVEMSSKIIRDDQPLFNDVHVEA